MRERAKFCLWLIVLQAVVGCAMPGSSRATNLPDPGFERTPPSPGEDVNTASSEDKLNQKAANNSIGRACCVTRATEKTPCGSLASTSWKPRDVFHHDRREFLPTLANDAKGLMNVRDLSLLGAALGGAIAIRQDWDDDVRDDVAEHPERWGTASERLGNLGEVQYQVPVLLGVYGYSLHTSDEELRSLSLALINAYTITGLSTLTVKVITDTERPSREWNDGRFGFPSFHTSSSFAIAAVVEEYEGLGAALPVYALAGLIGWSRIDEQDHDLSDVTFGAALGYVIGKSVARQHKNRKSGFRLKPYKHPEERAGGLAMEWRY